jgi:colanic acid/amylovoran biosynthesis glycosyltransferase
MKKIGYFIGQFPSPSHTYFWREINDLRSLGLEVDISSTQLPKTELAKHDWVDECVKQTIYLYPINFKQCLQTIVFLLKAFPFGWMKCFQSIYRADVKNLPEKIKLIAYILLGARLGSIATQQKWEHFHVGFCAAAANVALFSRLLGGPTYSLTLHSALSDFGSNQIQKWSNAKFGTAVSNNLLQELHQKIGAKLPPVFMVPMGVDVKKLVRQSNYVPWSKGKPLTIFCGARLTPRKGQLDLLKAAAIVYQKGVDVEIRLAGEDMGADKWFTNKLKTEAEALGLSNQLKLIGTISESRVYEELENAHLFILASYAEGMSVAVMEAMGMGVPVITTDVDGLPELVSNGETGVLVQPGNIDMLADKMMYIIEHPDFALQLSNNSVKAIHLHHRSELGAEILARKMQE